MANTDCLTFEAMSEYWMFCTPALLLYRYERSRAIARTDDERRTVTLMLERYLEEAKAVRRRQSVEGDEAGARETDRVIQRGHADRYAGPLIHDRFQVLESLTPTGTFYLVDHALPDLLVREGGPASSTRRFTSIGEAEKEANRLADRPAEITPAARRRGGLNMLPTGKPQQEIEMAKPKKAETPPKGAAAKKEPSTKADVKKTGTAPTAPVAKKAAAAPTNGGGEKRSRAPSHPPTTKITLLKKENPRRSGSNAAGRFDLYKSGVNTVGAASAKGISAAAMADDVKCEIIRIG